MTELCKMDDEAVFHRAMVEGLQVESWYLMQGCALLPEVDGEYREMCSAQVAGLTAHDEINKMQMQKQMQGGKSGKGGSGGKDKGGKQGAKEEKGEHEWQGLGKVWKKDVANKAGGKNVNEEEEDAPAYSSSATPLYLFRCACHLFVSLEFRCTCRVHRC